MDVCDESDTQSDVNDEMTDEMIDEDSSDDSSLIMEELARYRATVGGTIDAELLPPGYTPLNYAPYPNPLHLTICPPMNGLNISPVYYTSAPVAPHEYVIDDSNVANYEEVTTQAYSYPPPQATISLYSEIQRARAPTVSDDEEYPLAAVLQLPDYSANEYIPPPFRAPVLPMSVSTNAANNNNLSAEMTNAPPQPQPINNPSAPINNPSAPIDNPSAPINSHPFVSVNNPSVPTAPSQQATQIHAASQDESIQSAKKRGRKRLCDNAGGSKDGNMASDDVTPKKRGRKRKDGVDCADGKTNDSYENADNQSMDDANMEHISGDLDEAEKQNSKKSIQSLNAMTEIKSIDVIKEEKMKKKRSRKKTETKMDGAINDATVETKRYNSTRGKASITKKQCMEELFNSQKSRMAFPKGTFLIRYSDLETLDCDQIWCVDNHHMLLKYRLTSHIEGKRRLYLKSQPERFIGWKCEEPWHFYELTVLERDRDSSKVLILYPDAKELAECREKAKRQKQRAEEMKQGLGTSNDTDRLKQNFDGMEKNLPTQMHDADSGDQFLRGQENIEIQMVDEAANAIERFILVEDDYSTETDEEHTAEAVTAESFTDFE